MKEHIPKVSIGLPVYNGERYLRSTLDTLLLQDFTDFEVVISDNGSNDATPEICRAYAARDARVRYFRSEQNQGATWNYNRVFELARAPYFKWAAYDDECYPSMLRRCLETLEAAPPTVLLAYTRAEIIDENGLRSGLVGDIAESRRPKPHHRFGKVLFKFHLGNAFYGVFRREALGRTRRYHNIAVDRVLLGEIAMWGEIREVPEVLFRLRLHPSNAMAVNRTRRSMLVWFDPRLKGRGLLLPYELAVVCEHWKSVRHVPMSIMEKALCYLVPLVVPAWRRLLRLTGRPRAWVRGKLEPQMPVQAASSPKENFTKCK